MIKPKLAKKIFTNELLIQKGNVLEITEEKGVYVSLNNEMPAISCNILKSTDKQQLSLKEGDRVMVALPEYPGDRGCIMGIIENYTLAKEEKKDKYLLSRKYPLNEENVSSVKEDVIHIEALKGLKIQCGKGAITITEDGRINIEGTYLVSRSRGVNKIKGSAVKIN